MTAIRLPQTDETVMVSRTEQIQHAMNPSCHLLQISCSVPDRSNPKVTPHLFSLCLFITTLAVGLCRNGVALAQPANEPIEKSVVTDGTVYAIAKSSNILYFGGAFRVVGVRSGGGVPVSTATAEADSVYPMVNGDVSIAIGDGSGGWFVAGSFSEVGGFVRTNLVHIKSDRTVDAALSLSVIGGAVSSLVITNGTLYLAGSFTNVNGLVRNRAAALDIASGALTGWDPNVNGVVRGMVCYGTNVYLGGEYSSVGGLTRNGLAAVDTATGFVTSWNPNAGSAVEALLISNGHLYVGGYFSSVASQARSAGASFDLSSGNLDPWNPSVGGLGLVIPEIFSMDASQNTIFIAGVFGSAGTSNRVNVAALDSTTGLATSWDAKQIVTVTSGVPSGQVVSLAVCDGLLYVGGTLSNIGGQPRNYAAALDLVAGNATSWDPKPNAPPRAFSGSGNTLYLGGAFGALDCVDRTNLAAYDLDANQITPWNPGLITSSGPGVNTMLIANNQLYVGGFYTNIAGVQRYSLAALDLISGEASPWAPIASGTTIYSLATWNNRLYVGGTFNNIGGMLRTNFAEFDLDTGSVTSWDPAIRSFVQTMALDGNTLYVGGLFSTVSGQSRRRVAALDLTSGGLTGWNPFVTNGSSISSIAVSGNNVYLGGTFNVVNGFNRTNFVAVDATTAQVLPLVANADSFVYSVAATSNLVFIGGNFGVLSNQKRMALAALDVNTGNLTSWDSPADLFVRRLDIIDNTLYVEGSFVHLGATTTRSIGAYPLSFTGTPAIVSNSVQRLPNGNLQFRLFAPSVPQATIKVSTDLISWQPLQTVQIFGGYGAFTDTNSTLAKQFYRVSVP
jgi:hypothetical protein